MGEIVKVLGLLDVTRIISLFASVCLSVPVCLSVYMVLYVHPFYHTMHPQGLYVCMYV